MAPAGMEMSCTKGGCQFVTPDMEAALAMEYLKLHQANEHSEQPPQVGGQAVSAKPRAEKVPRPQIKLGVGQDEFSYFKDEWTSYKRSCGITDETETRDQLRAACSEDLRRNLFNCLGSKLKNPATRNITRFQLCIKLQNTELRHIIKSATILS